MRFDLRGLQKRTGFGFCSWVGFAHEVSNKGSLQYLVTALYHTSIYLVYSGLARSYSSLILIPLQLVVLIKWSQGIVVQYTRLYSRRRWAQVRERHRELLCVLNTCKQREYRFRDNKAMCLLVREAVVIIVVEMMQRKTGNFVGCSGAAGNQHFNCN